MYLNSTGHFSFFFQPFFLFHLLKMPISLGKHRKRYILHFTTENTWYIDIKLIYMHIGWRLEGYNHDNVIPNTLSQLAPVFAYVLNVFSQHTSSFSTKHCLIDIYLEDCYHWLTTLITFLQYHKSTNLCMEFIPAILWVQAV